MNYFMSKLLRNGGNVCLFENGFEYRNWSDFSVYVLFIGQDHLLPEAEEITMISIQLAARFLFTTGFHTKKVVRGSASDWYGFSIWRWIIFLPILLACSLVLSFFFQTIIILFQIGII